MSSAPPASNLMLAFAFHESAQTHRSCKYSVLAGTHLNGGVMKKPGLTVRGMFIGIALLVSAAYQAPPAVAQDSVNKAIDAKFSKYDGKLPLWAIQPGTAPRMIELTIYFNNMWFGAQAGNWDLARFEAYRSEEAVKGIYVVRPKRIGTVKPWTESALPP